LNQEALSVIDRALQIAENDDYSLDTKATILYNLGNYKESLELCNRSLGISENAIRLKQKAHALEKLGKKKEADDCIRKSTELEQKEQKVVLS
jgi:tetratricopeptide (TPR) repeat protein